MSEILKALIGHMKEDPLNERVAFEQLIAREDFSTLFDPLFEAGLFAPERNPVKRPAKEPGYYQIPFWAALEYLEKVAEATQRPENEHLVLKLLAVIKTVSDYRTETGEPVDNYHTWHFFAKILTKIPVKHLTVDIAKRTETWLSSKFDKGLVGNEIGAHLLPRVLGSEHPDRCEIAITLLSAATKIETTDEKWGNITRPKAVTGIDSYHLKALFDKNAKAFGLTCGREAIKLLWDRIEAVREIEDKSESFWSRPAIEDDPQNKYRDGAFNDLLTGLREILLAYVSKHSADAHDILANLLSAGPRIYQRLALYSINQLYEFYGALFWKWFKKPALLDSEVKHELYSLLQNNYKVFSSTQRNRVRKAIFTLRGKWGKIGKPGQRELLDAGVQRNWLSAVAGQGDSEVDERLSELINLVGEPSKFAKYSTYFETASGSGPSPYSVEQILQETCASLVTLLNDFVEKNEWQGPTVRSLSAVFGDAVRQRAEKFTKCLKAFHALKISYKHGLITGFQSALKEKNLLSWDQILDFLRSEIKSKQLWLEPDAETSSVMTPKLGWFLSSTADLLRSAFEADEPWFNSKQLDSSYQILDLILRKFNEEDVPNDDPLNSAINTVRGRCIEAIFAYALKKAKEEGKVYGHSGETWEFIEKGIERELRKCKNGNFAFSALCGNYFPQLMYLNQEWVRENVTNIFPTHYPDNFRAAVSGLAYNNVFVKEAFLILREKGVFEHALQLEGTASHVREKILQFLGIAYLNGAESIEDENCLFRKVILAFRELDIMELTGFFWMLREEASQNEPMMDKIFRYWELCMEIIKGREEQFPKILSKLSLLAVYVKQLNRNTVNLLIHVAPFVDEDYNSTFFLEELNRLCRINAEAVAQISVAMFARFRPLYPDDDLMRLIRCLYSNNQKEAANIICDRIKEFPAIRAIYGEFN